MPDLGSAVVPVHGDAAHSQTYVHLGGTITETITGLKTFSSVAKFVDGTATAPGITFTTENALGLYRVGAGELGLAATAGVTLVNGASGAYARIFRDGTIGGALGLGLNGTLDAYLYREAAAYILQRNGVNAQRHGVARTYTDAANYEVGELGWSGTTFRVGTSHAGTGAARSMALLAGGSERWTVDGTAGHLTAVGGTEQIRWGATASFPMLQRSAAMLLVRLADDSGYANLACANITSLGDVEGVRASFTGSVPAAVTQIVKVSSTLTPGSGVSAHGLLVAPTITEFTAGDHPRLVGAYFDTPVITPGAATVSVASTVQIVGAPSAGVENYALYVQDGSVRIAGAGPHAIGGALGTNHQLTIGGTFSGVANATAAVRLSTTVNAANVGNRAAFGMYLTPTLVTVADSTHTTFASLRLDPPTITINGTATVTDAATLYLLGAPTGGSANYALWIDAGRVRWDDPVALGGGAAPTFGTIGGSGPTAAAQNQWLRVNINGAERFIPVWA